MKKRLFSLLAALAVALGLLALPAAADEDPFFLALNDVLVPASAQTNPIQTGGWIYVPASVFSNQVTGVNFGVFYGFTEDNTNLVFYNLSGKTLTFDLTGNTASTSTGESVMPGRVVWRGGTCYVPAYALCSFFDLTYIYYNTEYGPLLRIKDGSARLSDAALLAMSDSAMRARYNAAQPQPPAAAPEAPASTPAAPSSSGGSSAATRPTGTTVRPSTAAPAAATVPASADQTPVQTETAPAPEPVKTFSLYLGVKANSDVTPALDALAAVNAAAVIFFPADSLNANADQIRQAAGRGHRVGLSPVGDTPEKRLESVRAGSRDLARILRQETWFVLATDREIADAGYLTWIPTATVPAGTDEDVYRAVYAAGSGRTGDTRLLSGSDQSIAPLLRRLAMDGDTFLATRETKY